MLIIKPYSHRTLVSRKGMIRITPIINNTIAQRSTLYACVFENIKNKIFASKSQIIEMTSGDLENTNATAREKSETPIAASA